MSNSCDIIELEFSTVKTSGRISDWQSLNKFCNKGSQAEGTAILAYIRLY